ncbi:MAG: HAMP domain-containing sensor histidine kinase [Bacteroidota bacterium]
MKKRIPDTVIPLLLMGSSMLLLGLFLAFWLRNLYREEVNRLQERSSFIFIDAVRSAETRYLKSELLSPILSEYTLPNKPLDSIGTVRLFRNTVNNIEKLKTKLPSDSLQITAFSFNVYDSGLDAVTERKGDSTLIEITSKMNVQVDDARGQNGANRATGAILSWLLGAHQSDKQLLLSKERVDSFLTKQLELILLASPKIEQLPPKIKIVRVSDSLPNPKVLLSETYQDIGTSNTYALAVPISTSYILGEIWPQLLFSLLLFSLTMLAFYTNYKNLRTQQRLTTLKNDLISNITHELKTPIATVAVAIEALQDFGGLGDPKRTEEYLDISKQELNRLSILVDKVLTTAQFEKTEFPLKKEQIDLKNLVQEVLDSMKLQFQKRGATAHFNVKSNDFLLMADPVHLTNVVYNLVDNALKYSPVSPQLSIDLWLELPHIRLAIQDNGLGIAKEYKDKIFDKFFRVPTGDTHTTKGYGLGLNYVKKVIEKHEGSIGVDSQLGKGTKFSIALPRLVVSD